MTFRRTLSASAALSALAALPHSALAQETVLPTVTIRANPLGGDENAQIITPAKVLAGDELRNKMGTSLGDTLSRELGVSATGFGAAASRPIVRGLEGPRVKMLENGMSTADVSSLSSDHAVGSDVSTARQVEILRGPAALLYGSGAIGGLINVVNDRIPTELPERATGEAELRLGTADKEKSLSFSADAAAGRIGLHLDGSTRSTDDYRIPGFAGVNDPASAYGSLPSSYTRSHALGFGASHVADWGHIGASVDTLNDHYGIPTDERSFIDLSRTRVDVDGLIKRPFGPFSSLKIKLGSTDYQHTEKESDGTPATTFSNRGLETRWELAHEALAGWRGSVGLQTDDSKLSALAAATGLPNTVPVTKSTSFAAFVVEERDFGPVRASGGLRLESVKRTPEGGAMERSLQLASYSLGGMWSFAPGYSVGATLSIAQRAPAIEELYSNGPHESTATFDIGDVNLQKEVSRNIELSLQKTEGKLRWKANLFENHVRNFVFGRVDGTRVDAEGVNDPAGAFSRRVWTQGDATIRGAEAEVHYNQHGQGPSWRVFADTSRGTLDNAGNLPLQPATRFGAEAGYREGAWRGGISILRAQRQDRLASFESSATPPYTRLDANLAYTSKIEGMDWTVFALGRNLLNQDIRLSTSLLRDVAPQPGRNLVVGVRTRF